MNRSQGRRVGASVLVAIAIVLSLVASLGVWAKRTVLSADRVVVAAVDQAAGDPAVVDALAERLTDELISVIDFTGIVASALPDQLDRLAPIINAAVKRVVRDQITAVVDSGDGRRILGEAVRVAHDTAIHILRGGGLRPDKVFVVVDGEVRLDLVPVIGLALQRLQDAGVIPGSFDLVGIASQPTTAKVLALLSKVFGVTIPDDFGQITILTSEQVRAASSTLSTAQRALAIFERGTALLVVLALLFLAAAFVVSVDRRRTLVQVAAGIGIGAVLLRIARQKVIDAVDAAIDATGAKQAAIDITGSLTSSLMRTLGLLALVGITVALVAHLLRPGKDGGVSWLTGTIAAHPDAARGAIGAFGLALLVITGLALVPVLVVGALVVAGMLAVGRRTGAGVAVAD